MWNGGRHFLVARDMSQSGFMAPCKIVRRTRGSQSFDLHLVYILVNERTYEMKMLLESRVERHPNSRIIDMSVRQLGRDSSDTRYRRLVAAAHRYRVSGTPSPSSLKQAQ